MQNPQYADKLGLDSVEDQVIAIVGYRPEPYADFLFVGVVLQNHSLGWHLSKLKALFNDCCSYARSRCRVVGRNIVLNLIKVLLSQSGKEDRELCHRLRRRTRLDAGTKERVSSRAVCIARLRSSRLALAFLASCSSRSRRPARITSDLLLNRPLAIHLS